LTLEPRQETTIRRARPEDAATLSALAFRSKAYWGYDAAFMEACRDDLTLDASDLAASVAYVVEERGLILGFYRLHGHDGDEVTLTDLFMAPEAIGHGHGRRLWLHAVRTATSLGFRAMMLQSEPHAEGFYRAMGAVRIGESPSTVFPDRVLPLMRVSLMDRVHKGESV